MGIYSKLVCLVTGRFHDPDLEYDDRFDRLIQDALFDDALACPSRDAWDRLRQAIVERQLKQYGMWVLDEPQRDPPESSPMLLSGHEFDYAWRIHGGYLTARYDLRRDVIWGGMSPTFSVMPNW